MKKQVSGFALAPAVALASAALCAPGIAHAQFAERIYLHVEGGVSGFIGSPQADRFGLGFDGSARLGIRIIGPVAIHAMAGYWNWGESAPGTGFATMTVFGGGIRIAPRISRSAGQILIDLEAGAGTTGANATTSPYLSAGLGWAIPVAGPFELGPIARFGQLMATGNQSASVGGSGAANMWNVGLFLGLHPQLSESQQGPADTDSDGVADDVDQCPTTPQGDRPDPSRPGCPAPSEDMDADGVPDAQDLCPSIPQGESPDPARRGCPAGDRDGDGVVDAQDPCPDTPAGPRPDATRRGCPDNDRDHDGVPDSMDLCPDAPAGSHPDSQRPGCPTADRDHDTVPDTVDHCPDQPGSPSTDPARNGCPSVVRMDAGRISILEPVLFAANRASIKRRSHRVLDTVADVLRSTPEIRRVSVDGHTDDHGDPERNLALSQARAEAVVAYLVARGVEASRLEAHGFGVTRPIAPNTSAANRARNRRVEFIIIDPPNFGAGATDNAPTAAPPGNPVVQIVNVNVPDEDTHQGHHGHHGHHGGGHHGHHGGGGHHHHRH